MLFCRYIGRVLFFVWEYFQTHAGQMAYHEQSSYEKRSKAKRDKDFGKKPCATDFHWLFFHPVFEQQNFARLRKRNAGGGSLNAASTTFLPPYMPVKNKK